jgi:hypothetical protein
VSLLLPNRLAQCWRKIENRKHQTSENKTQNQTTNLQIPKIDRRIRNGSIELIVVEIAPQISKNKETCKENERNQNKITI